MRIRTIVLVALLTAFAGTAFSVAYSQDSSAANIASNLALLQNTGSCSACDLRGVNLSGADLRNADLYKSDLRGANLANANLGGASLFGVRLDDANVSNANFTLANLKEASVLTLQSAITNSSTTCPNGEAGPCN